MSNIDITLALNGLLLNYSEESASEVIETMLYNPTDLSDQDHEIIDQLDSRFLRMAAQIFVEDLAYDFNTLVNYWEAFIGQLTENQSNKLLEFALEQTDVEFVEDFIIGYRKFYVNPKESLIFFNKLDQNEFHEILFFIGRCHEALENYQEAINAYQNYLNHPYFKEEENKEQFSINSFYINHTISSLYYKLNNFDQVVKTASAIIDPIGIDKYLEIYTNYDDQEIKSFLVEYKNALINLNLVDKATSLQGKIDKFFKI